MTLSIKVPPKFRNALAWDGELVILEVQARPGKRGQKT